MANDNELVIRTRDFKLAPDVESYVQNLSNDGTLERLSKEANLNADTIRNMPLGKICDIFVERASKGLLPGDVIVFGNYGTFEIYTDGTEWRKDCYL